MAEHCDELWEGLETAVGALDPDNAVEHLLVGLSKLTGVYRRPAAVGWTTCDLTFDAATTIAAGALVLAVTGEPSNTWANAEEIVAAGAGTVEDVRFESTVAAATAVAPAGSLDIASPLAGLVSVNQPNDATPGTDAESLTALRLRREDSLAATGSATAAAIAAAVSALDGVIDARAYENTSDVPADGILPHRTRVVVWDGDPGQADDDLIAQTVFEAAAAGVQLQNGSDYLGTASSGTATDEWGGTHTIVFDRPYVQTPTLAVTMTGTLPAADVKAALVAAHEQLLGVSIFKSRLIAALMSQAGVTDVVGMDLSDTDAYGNHLVPAGRVAVLETANITVTYV
ncbi:MAG: baseplate J/gp47 family protein [bacterium]